MSLDHTDIITSISTLLTANTTPVFTVVHGEPLALAPDGSPFACYWYLGRTDPPEGRRTLRNVMYAARFRVICLWHRPLEIGSFTAMEDEIGTADDSLRAAFRGDSTLNGTATDLDISDSQVDYGAFPLQGEGSAIYRSLEFDLLVTSLEGETIAQ